MRLPCAAIMQLTCTPALRLPDARPKSTLIPLLDVTHGVRAFRFVHTPTCRIFSEKSSPSAVCVPLRPVRWFARACSVEHLMNFNRSCACTSRQVRSSFRSFLHVLPLVGSGWYSLRSHCYNTSECGRAPMVVAHSSG